ncbi:MAG: hypothetical protein IKN58_02150 [Prevotella sp.]|nr:hypothetical protein [Prevotella sp.]
MGFQNVVPLHCRRKSPVSGSSGGGTTGGNDNQGDGSVNDDAGDGPVSSYFG